MSGLFTRRQFSGVAASLLAGTTTAKFALASDQPAPSATDSGILRTQEAIHQEVQFNVVRSRIYEALTETKKFAEVTKLSAAAQSMTLPTASTEISREAGGQFTLFGGYIVGRHIELVPGERIVQAWRAGNWDPGIYSIVRFELVEQGTGTKLSFDHTGFPAGQAEHLAHGWHSNYWQPLQKYLA